MRGEPFGEVLSLPWRRSLFRSLRGRVLRDGDGSGRGSVDALREVGAAGRLPAWPLFGFGCAALRELFFVGADFGCAMSRAASFTGAGWPAETSGACFGFREERPEGAEVAASGVAAAPRRRWRRRRFGAVPARSPAFGVVSRTVEAVASADWIVALLSGIVSWAGAATFPAVVGAVLRVGLRVGAGGVDGWAVAVVGAFGAVVAVAAAVCAVCAAEAFRFGAVGLALRLFLSARA